MRAVADFCEHIGSIGDACPEFRTEFAELHWSLHPRNAWIASGYSESAAVSSVQGERSRILHKPFRVADLQAAIAELLKSAAGRS